MSSSSFLSTLSTHLQNPISLLLTSLPPVAITTFITLRSLFRENDPQPVSFSSRPVISFSPQPPPPSSPQHWQLPQVPPPRRRRPLPLPPQQQPFPSPPPSPDLTKLHTLLLALRAPSPADPCPICFDPKDPNLQETCILMCGHQFHTTCLYSWTSIHPTCPLCRRQTAGEWWVRRYTGHSR